MAAIRRPNKLLEVVNPMEAVLDIMSPFLNAADRQASKGKSTYTRCHEQSICLHSSILSFAVQYNDFRGGHHHWPSQKGRRRPAALKYPENVDVIRRRPF